MNLGNKSYYNAKLSVPKLLFQPKFLWILITAYVFAVVASNWLDPRQINIFGLCTGAGSIIFPLTYLLADTITEVYGYKYARRTIWCGFLFNLIFVSYGQLILYLVSNKYPHIAALNQFLSFNIRIMLASMITYLITESINPYLMAKLKIFFAGKYLGIRFLLATVTAHILNELVYAPIAFYGQLRMNDFVNHILDSWMFMLSIELVLLPIFIRLAVSIKKREQIDVYDNDTKFSIFDFKTNYSKDNNKFLNNQESSVE